MNTWIRRSLNVGALAAGALLVAGTAAHADTNLNTSHNAGIGNGNQVYAPIQLPVDVCGLAVGVIGNAQAGCAGGASARHGWDEPDFHTLPVTWSGESHARHRTQHCYTVPTQPAKAAGYNKDAPPKQVCDSRGTHRWRAPEPRSNVHLTTGPNFGIANGNQVYVPIQVPINLCGNALAVIGNAQASCVGGASALQRA